MLSSFYDVIVIKLLLAGHSPNFVEVHDLFYLCRTWDNIHFYKLNMCH